ncbi:uncharacterized protein LAJ45_01027 [Morchella importuna]|uniref:uncharacterized protein n=1 Tax=Morchella importuna TaxID=1174673 RepID=UPI001E8D7301|nr:uncharacterized protein LAJ45_01027 [Morchella importuna]KAH8154499.1 hypothetical protein LAJ45_01027 [Morchella importuna]
MNPYLIETYIYIVLPSKSHPWIQLECSSPYGPQLPCENKACDMSKMLLRSSQTFDQRPIPRHQQRKQ